jgi:CHAD domain-containing protein
MAYRLRSDESVPAAIKRIASEELESAAAQLTGKGAAERDEAIHEARKSIKKVRALLRLMRPELGDTYAAENTQLRDTGRKLSEFRDAGAILETFYGLREKYRDELKGHTLESIHGGLVERKEQAGRTAGIGQVLRKLAAALRAAGRRVRVWPLLTDGFPAIAPGLERTFRSGQKAFAQVLAHPSPENYHEWRKRVKDHWYHVRLLEDVWIEVMQAYERSLKDLETWLGDDHNLVVLREKVVSEPVFYGGGKETDLFLSFVDKYEKELRGNALSLGERIYAEKPRQFSQRLGHLWNVWQAQPESLDELEKQEHQEQKNQKPAAARPPHLSEPAA